MAADLPSHAQAVIIGGGVVGCSVAYHLAKLGWRDVVLLERRQLTCGTTWHAAGLIGQLRATPNLTRLAKYSAELYLGLEAETGQPTGFKQNGSIGLARTAERLAELRRQASMGRAFGLEVHEVTPWPKPGQLYPLIEVGDLAGAIHIPADGQANPIDIAQALAKGARQNGARIVEGCKVTGITKRTGRVTGVETEHGPIRAEVVVNCAGMWGRAVGRMAGVSVPLHACEHFYIVTEPMPEVPPDLPVLRDPDGCIYFKEDAGKLLVGAFEPVAKPWGMDGIPDDFEFGELPEDWDHFVPILEDAMRRMPALERDRHPQVLQRPGELHARRSLSARRGARARGLLRRLRLQLDRHPVGGRRRQGAGRMDRRRPSADRPGRRRHPAHAAVPEQRPLPARPRDRGSRAALRDALAVSAVRDRAAGAHARRSTTASRRGAPASARPPAGSGRTGSRRAGVAAASTTTPTGARTGSSTRRPSTGRCASASACSTSRRSASSWSRGATPKRCCSGSARGDIAVAPGRIVYTQWLNERGGIEADLTVTRLAETRIWSSPAPPARPATSHWLKRHIPDEAHAFVDRRDLGPCGARP